MKYKKVQQNKKLVFPLQLNFDLQKAKDLRNAVNKFQTLSLRKKSELKKGEEYFAWDRICAIMDRLEDTIDYLNMCTLGNCKSNRSAFDFYEFINNSYVIIECIRKMAVIFEVDKSQISDIDDSQKCFGNVMSANGSDGKFFSYIRSLCAVHPIDTSAHGHPYLKGDRFHCCPFVVWCNNGVGLLRNDNRDLSVHIYNSQPNSQIIDIPLYVNQFIDYLNEWIALIPEIIKAIDNYNIKKYDEFKSRKMQLSDQFNNIVDYLKYLKSEQDIRFGDEGLYVYDQYIKIFKITLTNQNNQAKLEKYKNSIKYSLPFLHNSLQTMNHAGFENSGIKNKDEYDNDLFNLLSYPSYNDDDFKGYFYNLSKVYYLETDYGYENKLWARHLLEEMKTELNKYVVFNNTESDEETVILVNLALYLSCLTNNCTLNQNIPNDLNYREKLLSGSEIEDLNSENNNDTSNTIDDGYILFENEDGTIKKVKFTDYIKNIRDDN